MNAKKFSDAMSEPDTKYVDEALNCKKKGKKPGWTKWAAIAACLVVVLAVGIFAPFQGSMIVSAYAYGTDEEITTAGAVMNSGTISDTGEMKGHPLMFYLSGKDIVSVRFSCKNEQINFMDWSEKRDECGNAQNFTVAYGEDESEYYYLLIDWVPNTLIRELTDNPDSKIATLPEEMRQDIIVMEITFENGKTAAKAITISLLDDGTFFAVFDDYEISKADTFINRPDSITFTGTIVDNVIESSVPVILVDVDENSELKYDKVLFELTEEQEAWTTRVGTRVQIVCPDSFEETLPPVGSLISIAEVAPDDRVKTASEF